VPNPIRSEEDAALSEIESPATGLSRSETTSPPTLVCLAEQVERARSSERAAGFAHLQSDETLQAARNALSAAEAKCLAHVTALASPSNELEGERQRAHEDVAHALRLCAEKMDLAASARLARAAAEINLRNAQSRVAQLRRDLLPSRVRLAELEIHISRTQCEVRRLIASRTTVTAGLATIASELEKLTGESVDFRTATIFDAG
jgi:chromosome segregation ATPase